MCTGCGNERENLSDLYLERDDDQKADSVLTLKAPVLTAADDIHTGKYFFIVFQRK